MDWWSAPPAPAPWPSMIELWNICWQDCVLRNMGPCVERLSALVRLRVFILKCLCCPVLFHPASLGSIDSAYVPMYADFFVPAIGRNRHRAASTAALGRLSAVQYAPYVDDRSYLLHIVNAQFERMTEDELKRIAVAHCMSAVSLLGSPLGAPWSYKWASISWALLIQGGRSYTYHSCWLPGFPCRQLFFA